MASEAIPPLLPEPPPVPCEKPRVVVLYRLWCALFILIYAAICIYELCKFRGLIDPSLGPITEILVKEDAALKKQLLAQAREDAFGGVVVSILGTIFYGVASLVPRRRWGWIIGVIALIGSVFPFCITAAGAIPLLIGWMKPQARIYFSALKPLR